MTYSSAVVRDARALHRAGWSVSEICVLVAEDAGQQPAWSTVCRWVDEDYAGRRRRLERDSKRRKLAATHAGQLKSNFKTVEARLARIHRFIDAGLSDTAIAKVMNIDFPDVPLTCHQINGIRCDGRIPRPLRAIA